MTDFHEISLHDETIDELNQQQSKFSNCLNCIQQLVNNIRNRLVKIFNVCFPCILHYYTHLIFIIVFEIIFFFKYATKIEKELIYKLVEDIVITFVNVYIKYNPNINPIDLSYEMTQFICDEYNQMANNHNETIYQNCLFGIIVIISVFALILLLGCNFYGYKLVSNIVIDSIVLIFLLGIWQYIFFEYVILNYKIITIGEIICVAVETVYKYLQKN